MAVLLILAMVTTLVVNWNLRGTGIAATADYECGMEEHVHDKDCYELVCTEDGEDGDIKWSKLEAQDNADTAEFEIGTAEETEDVTEAETKEDEMTASPSDAAKDDSDAKQHIHTKKCYRLICEIPEHIHTSKCMSNIASEVETKEDWEATLPEFTGDENQAQKMVAVAESQIGYHESVNNFKLADDGVTKQGYTRYGEWYGNPYGDWSAMFAAFVLHYAGISKNDFPVNSGCQAWIMGLKQKELYGSGGSYEPNYGDLVFLDLDEDSQADHVGIVVDLERDEEEENLVSVTAVMGDLNDAVEETQCDAAGAEILGYGMIPDNGIRILPDAADGTVIDMAEYVTGISGSGAKYDAKGNIYFVDIQTEFTFEGNQVSENRLHYYYEYPDGIIIPSGLLTEKNHDLLDSNNVKAGTYHFYKTKNGKYRVGIDFDEEYIKKHGTEGIKGYVRFSGQVSADKADQDGNIKVVGSDEVQLVIPKDQIDYPDDETNQYDISASKSGFYEIKDGKLIYTVYVTSIKGTPDNIEFKDMIETEGMELDTPAVTVEKQTVPRYDYGNGNYGDGNPESSEEISVNPTYENGKLEMPLPQIEKAMSGEDAKGTSCLKYTRYKVVYTYDVSKLTAKPSAKNKVSASSSRNGTEVKSESECDIGIENTHSLDKAGWFDANNNRIYWTITVNRNCLDIAGAVLTDDMLEKLAAGTEIKITPTTGVTVEKDSNGKITGIKFNAVEDGMNKNTYKIEYCTEAKAQWNDQVINNDAKFTPGDNSGAIDKTGTVTIGGGSVAKSVEDADVSEDGTTAVVKWKSTISIPAGGLPEGTEITDDSTKNQWGGTGGRQYMTRDQVIKWAQEIYWTDDNGNKIGAAINLTEGDLADITFTASDGKQYSWSQINSGNQDFADLLYTVWNVKLKQNLAQPDGAKKLIFVYKTTADLEGAGIGTKNYYNMIRVGNREASATYVYRKGGLVKTDETGSADTTSKVNEDGTLIWKITADLAKESGYLKITDYLPDGVKLISLKGEGNINDLNTIPIDGNGNISKTNNGYNVTGTYENQKIQLKLTRTGDQKLGVGAYTFAVTCKVDKENLTDYETGRTYTFTNTATANTDSGSIGSADQTQEWTEKKKSDTFKVVDKTGRWNNDTRRVEYSIVLNPEGKDIVEGSGVLELRDVLEYYHQVYAIADGQYGNGTPFELSAWLVPESVHLYRAEKLEDGALGQGSEITNWKWTVETGKKQYRPDINTSTILASNLPDETPMILTYAYQFQADIPEQWHSTSNMSVNNEAELVGTGYKDGKTQNDTNWSKQDHSAGVSTYKRYTVYKVSMGNYGMTLPGAVFKLQKYNGTEYEDTGDDYTTDQDGKIIIQWQKDEYDIWYDANTLYRLIETQPPQGYILPEDTEKNAVYFYFTDITDNDHILPAERPANAYDLAEGSHMAYIENESRQTEITIVKEWQNVDGSRLEGKQGSISVNLYQRASSTPVEDGGEASITGEIKRGDVTYGNAWKSIEKADYPVGTEVKITLTSPDGYMESSSPELQVDGVKLTPIVSSGENSEKIYSYSFALHTGTNNIQGCVPAWHDAGWKVLPIETKVPDARKYDTYEISADEGWTKTITGLPAIDVDSDGKRIYYSYYVEEAQSGGSYEVTYDNNSGIVSGTITITNKSTTDENYRLPETGGTGTIPFRTAGLAIISLAVLSNGILRCRRGRKTEHTEFRK